MTEVIGLTGGIGTGKSLISRILRTRGYAVYDCDHQAKKLMDNDEALLSEMQERWGKDVCNESGLPDRSRIAAIVFADPIELEWLNSKVHTAVKADIAKWLSEQKKEKPVFIESAILGSSGLTCFCDEIWEVTAPEKERLHRLELRSGMKEKEALARIKAQEKESELLRKESRRVRVIDNDGRRSLLRQIPAAVNL